MAAPLAPHGVVAAPGARPRRRLARPAVIRQPWPVAAVPDAVPDGAPDAVPAGGPVRVGPVPGAVPIPGGAPVALPVPPTVVLPDAASARTDFTGAPLPAVSRPPRTLIVLRPVAGPTRRAPIRHGHVPGTPVRAHRALWGPPQPAH
ncbi:hypothetical protein [Actinomycetospora cinnamomea]|nr:hypothetical protein [Actinomycetospora cinnamomea]